MIAAVGNFDEERLMEMFEEKLLGFRENKITEKTELKDYKQSFNVKIRDIEQTHICLAIPGVSLKDDMYYAFVLMNNIFGGSMSSRLFQNIREERGLAYSVTSMNMSSSYWGSFCIYAGVAHDKAEEALGAIAGELEKLRKEGVSEEELEMAKEQVKSSYIFGLESVNSRMFSIGKNKLLLDRVYSDEEILSSFDKVTLDDIEAAAGIVGDYTSYCGAAVTGRELDLERIVKNAD